MTKHQFSADTAKVLNLVIHSLYTNKDIFLRELISNASDACDKLRFEAQKNDELIKGDADLKITLRAEKDSRTLTITDNGIGMNEEDLINNLGTIARSGTQNFIEALSGDNKKDVNLIGQFGVGFYSAFMVADSVTVTTKKVGEDQAYQWQSKGDGEFTITKTDKEARGTTITLQLNSEADDYLDRFRLQHIVQTYSNHISIPIEYINDEAAENPTETLNTSKAIWLRDKKEISKEDYNEFYKTVSHLPDEPWAIIHNSVEGMLSYTNLLFIPTTRPFDLFHPDRSHRVKLYVKRVFIGDETLDVIPRWLRFLRGVVDSEDLSLNISRESLQHSAMIDKIRESVTKKVLSELKKKLSKDQTEYEKFWENFGPVLKEGLCEGIDSKDKVFETCLFNSSAGDNLTTLDAYIERAKESQKEIYYITGEDLTTLRNSPQIEGFISKGIEVILLNDHVDDFWLTNVRNYKDYKFVSAARSDVNLDKYENAGKDKDKPAEDTKPSEAITLLIAKFKEQLGEQVRDVVQSTSLTTSPVRLAIKDGDMDMKMERFLVEQNQLQGGSKKILELNANHPLILKLADKLNADSTSKQVEQVINLLHAQALVVEGESLTDKRGFSDNLNGVLEQFVA